MTSLVALVYLIEGSPLVDKAPCLFLWPFPLCHMFVNTSQDILVVYK
jgi:hypothetical protein